MKNKSRKEFLSNLFSLGSVDILTLLIPIVLLPVLTRTLGSELYGQYVLFLSIVVFGHTIIDFGVQYTGIRNVAKIRTNKSKEKLFFLRYQGLRACNTILYLVLFSIYVYFFYNQAFKIEFLIAGYIYMVGYAFNCGWYLRAIGKSKYIFIITLSTKVVFLFFVLLFIKTENDFGKLIFIFSMTSFINGFGVYFFSRIGSSLNLFTFKFLKKDLKEGLVLFIGIFAPNLYNTIPLIVTGTIYPPKEFATFAICSRVCGVIYTAQNVISKSLYPIVVRDRGFQLKRIIFLYLTLTIPAGLTLSLYGIDIVKIFLNVDIDTNIYFLIFTSSIVFVSISNAISTGFFLPRGFDYVYRNISIRVSFVSMLCAIYFIASFGVLGAALSILIARFLLMIDSSFSYLKFR